MTTSETTSSSFDAAALAVATAAGAFSVFVAPGPYSWFSGIIGVTLLVTIWAYESTRTRTWLQRLALSMSCAFISSLIFGLIGELILSGPSLRGICPIDNTPYTFDCQMDPESAVSSSLLAVLWIITTIVIFWLDLWYERRFLKAEKK